MEGHVYKHLVKQAATDLLEAANMLDNFMPESARAFTRKADWYLSQIGETPSQDGVPKSTVEVT